MFSGRQLVRRRLASAPAGCALAHTAARRRPAPAGEWRVNFVVPSRHALGEHGDQPAARDAVRHQSSTRMRRVPAERSDRRTIRSRLSGLVPEVGKLMELTMKGSLGRHRSPGRCRWATSARARCPPGEPRNEASMIRTARVARRRACGGLRRGAAQASLTGEWAMSFTTPRGGRPNTPFDMTRKALASPGISRPRCGETSVKAQRRQRRRGEAGLVDHGKPASRWTSSVTAYGQGRRRSTARSSSARSAKASFNAERTGSELAAASSGNISVRPTPFRRRT